MKNYQIITGDVGASAKMSARDREQLRAAFDFLAGGSVGDYDYFVRGDGFQLLLTKDALRESLRIKSYLYGLLAVRVRISIGIGTISYHGKRVSDSDGEAFWFSGRTLEEMKANREWIKVTTAIENWNNEWLVHAATLDYLEQARTQNQSEALYWQIEGKTQQEIAGLLGISQPSVHSRLKGTGWPLIEKIMNRYEQLQAHLTTDTDHVSTI